jgi:molybdate transport system substrate-binding protein
VKLLAIFAAASLMGVFPAIDRAPKYQFAGSDQLAFQITQGARADVFAAASPKYPEQLYAQGLCSKPAVFATNTVVLVVPRANPARIHSVYDLTRDGIKLVIGSKGVPIGDYTRKLLANLGLSSALKNVVSEEDDVKLVVAKVALGEADAGFVYRTDVKPVGNRVFRIAVPAAGQPTVQYELCVPTTAQHPKLAAAFVREVLSKRGRALLRTSGFGLP